jgi:hypothetical protein
MKVINNVMLLRLSVFAILCYPFQGEGIAVVETTSCASNSIAVLPQLGQITAISRIGGTLLHSDNNPC